MLIIFILRFFHYYMLDIVRGDAFYLQVLSARASATATAIVPPAAQRFDSRMIADGRAILDDAAMTMPSATDDALRGRRADGTATSPFRPQEHAISTICASFRWE